MSTAKFDTKYASNPDEAISSVVVIHWYPETGYERTYHVCRGVAATLREAVALFLADNGDKLAAGPRPSAFAYVAPASISTREPHARIYKQA